MSRVTISMAPAWAGAILCLFSTPAETVHGNPTFFVSPNAYPALSSVLDVPWQNAVGNNFTEFDLDGYANGASVDTIPAGFTTIDVNLGGLGGPASAADIFFGDYPPGGGVYGTVWGGALLNQQGTGGHGEIIFSFSTPVLGFGAWIFDNSSASAEAFEVTVTEVGGGMTTSSALEAGNGIPHFVEGWIGATSGLGITDFAIRVLDANTLDPVIISFEVDHLQVAPIPAPGAWLLGLLGIAVARPRRRA